MSHASTKQAAPWMVTVEAMQPQDSEELVTSFLRQFHKSLTPSQMAVLLAKDDAGSPLYLITACSSLLQFGIYEEMNQELSKLPAKKIPLLASMIHSLKQQFGEEVIRSTLLLVYFSQVRFVLCKYFTGDLSASLHKRSHQGYSFVSEIECTNVNLRRAGFSSMSCCTL